jgi:putative DNA primase/helicase
VTTPGSTEAVKPGGSAPLFISLNPPLTEFLLEAALAYVDLGWPVLPLHTPLGNDKCSCGRTGCSSVGKHPRATKGLLDASRDPDRIREWWSWWPDANIGLHTDGWAVWDFDPKSGGLETLAQWEAEFPNEFAGAPRVLTGEWKGERGVHIYLRQSGTALRSTTNVAPGVDFRADGGYVVAPPSLHWSGVSYEWVV